MKYAVMALLLFAATPDGMAPLPAQYLKGGTFSSPDGWFAVHAPDGSEWLEMQRFDGGDPRWPDAAHDRVAWYVRGAKMPESLLVMESYRLNGEPLDDAYGKAIEPSVSGEARLHGDTISDYSYQLITTPVRGIRYTYRKTQKDGTSKWRFWYATGTKHKVFLESSSAVNVEPKWLSGVVQSFRWLKNP
ncbi:MAG TPA: hypothetical protein VII75_07560 [Thermoanaerobaculia bacterium]